MNEISAALGISQLKNLKKFVKERNQIARYYEKNLNKNHLLLPYRNKNCLSSYHLFIIKIKGKNYKKIQRKLFNFLRKKNFYVQVHYLPVHLQPYYQKSLNLKLILSLTQKNMLRVLYQYQYILDYLKNLYKLKNLINNFITSNV